MRRDAVKHGWEVAKNEVDRLVNAPIPMPRKSSATTAPPPAPVKTVAASPMTASPTPTTPATTEPVAQTTSPVPADAPTVAAPLTPGGEVPIETPRKGRRKHEKSEKGQKDKKASSVVAPVVASASPTPEAGSSAVRDAEAKLAAGDPDAALQLARVAVKDGDPSVAALRIWARSAYAAGHPMESHEACLAWISRTGDDLEAKMLDARALHSGGHDEEARDRLDDVLSTHPTCAEAKSMKKDLATLQKTKGAPLHKAKRRSAML